jgi:hypothetical protein
LRRFAPEFYNSGFRVKPGMTIHFFDDGHFFASPGVHPQPAAKTRANDYSPLHAIAGRAPYQRPAKRSESLAFSPACAPRGQTVSLCLCGEWFQVLLFADSAGRWRDRRPAKTPKLRHCWLNPESSSSF